MKKIFYSEIAYLFGIFLLALGTGFMAKADFGMSMVVAPAYICYVKISQILPFFTFGMAEYCLQLLLIIMLSLILKKFRFMYLFSFITAVLYGVTLDGCMNLLSRLVLDSFTLRSLAFVMGIFLCTTGIAFLFRTYFAPEAYELVVKELALKTGQDIGKLKIIYDMSSLAVSVFLSFAFFGWMNFVGIKAGTFITALVNGPMIGVMTKVLDKNFEFRDLLQWKRYFG